MLDQIGLDLQEAVQELRNLAHGIYPPLLMDRGLSEALARGRGPRRAADRVEAEGIGRYPQQVEAAVYFCCLEALQNAGKHAGEGAEATITLREEEGALLFEVADTAPASTSGRGAPQGHGFVNMSDRVGAFGGSVAVDSAPGQGTRIGGRIPLPSAEASERDWGVARTRRRRRRRAELLLVDVPGRAARRRRPGGRRPGTSTAAARASGCALVMRRVASMPLIPGRLMSMSTRPGSSARTARPPPHPTRPRRPPRTRASRS